MPFAILIAGIFFITAAIRGNQDALFALLKDDFSGSNNFIYWVMAFVFIVAIGAWKTIRPVSDAFLGLALLVLIISSRRNGKDLFTDFLQQVKIGTTGQDAPIIGKVNPNWISNAQKSVTNALKGAATDKVTSLIGKVL